MAFWVFFSEKWEGENLLVLYHPYIDDSADRNRERLIVCGAIIWEKELGHSKREMERSLTTGRAGIFQIVALRKPKRAISQVRQYGIHDGKRHALLVRDDLYAPVTGLGVTRSVPFHRIMRD